MRTIKQFISKTNKVYFYFKDTDTCKTFYSKAEAEGITFGGSQPTTKEPTDLIALLPSGEICYVGWAGHMCYHYCTEGVIRIDYAKYINDETDYHPRILCSRGKPFGKREPKMAYQKEL